MTSVVIVKFFNEGFVVQFGVIHVNVGIPSTCSEQLDQCVKNLVCLQLDQCEKNLV